VWCVFFGRRRCHNTRSAARREREDGARFLLWGFSSSFVPPPLLELGEIALFFLLPLSLYWGRSIIILLALRLHLMLDDS
jgi:hypothetical protein